MRRSIPFTALAMVVLGLGAIGGGLAGSPRAGADTTGPYYLALGDSVPVWNGYDSYPYLIASNYASTNPGLQVVDMACSGETTGTMLINSLCAPNPERSQQHEALAFLEAHRGQVALITVDIGGNDLLPCVNGLSVDLSCIQQAESTMAQNLDFILTGIRQAAGPTVPIVGMNYYDPFLGDWLAGGAVQVEANLSVSLVTQLNTLIAGAFQTVAAPTTDVAAAFDTTDLTDMVSSPWGQVPVAVDKACTWLDIVCTAGSTEGFGDDPNNDGAKVIAQAFEQTIGPAITPVTTSTTSTTSTSTSTSTTTSTTTSTSVPSPAQTTTSSPVVAARSGSLAFTGAGTPLRLMAVGGGLLASTGGLLLVAFGVPRRLRRSGR